MAGKVGGFQGFSPDKNLILYAYDKEDVWRHSSIATYVVKDPKENKVDYLFFFGVHMNSHYRNSNEKIPRISCNENSNPIYLKDRA